MSSVRYVTQYHSIDIAVTVYLYDYRVFLDTAPLHTPVLTTWLWLSKGHSAVRYTSVAARYWQLSCQLAIQLLKPCLYDVTSQQVSSVYSSVCQINWLACTVDVWRQQTRDASCHCHCRACVSPYYYSIEAVCNSYHFWDIQRQRMEWPWNRCRGRLRSLIDHIRLSIGTTL